MTCSARPEVDIARRARAVAPHAVDPTLRLDDGFVARLEDLAARLPGQDRWLSVSQTVEDHLLEEAEPAFCAFRPAAFASVIRQMAREARIRGGQALQSLLWGLRGHEMLLGDREWDGLSTAWARLTSKAPEWVESDIHLEADLFGLILMHCAPGQQARLLAGRPAAALDLVAYEGLFRWPPDWPFVLELLDSPADAKSVRRVLWYLGRFADTIPADVVARIAPLWRHDDSLVRACVLKVLHDAGTEEQIRDVVEGGWSASRIEANHIEDHWGSWLLIDRAKWLFVPQIQERVPEDYYADAVEQRGGEAPDVLTYAKWLDKRLVPHESIPLTIEIRRDERRDHREVFRPGFLPAEEEPRTVRSRPASWGDAAAGTTDQLKRAFDWQTQEREAADLLKLAQQKAVEARRWNMGLIDTPSRRMLAMIARAVPQVAESWLLLAFSEDPKDARRVVDQPALYQDLCAVLLELSPEKGLGLYRRLKATSLHRIVDSSTRIETLELALWAAPTSPAVEAFRREAMIAATSDADLSRIAYCAEYGGSRSSLEALIAEGRDSARLLDQARAFTVGCLLSDAESRNELPVDEDGTWLAEVRATGLLWARANGYARHWYRRFLAAPTELDAWAGFRLLLRCVDKRIWLWKPVLDAEVGGATPPARRMFLNAHRPLLRRAIERNERALHKTLVGTKVLDSSAWPWMGVAESMHAVPGPATI